MPSPTAVFSVTASASLLPPPADSPAREPLPSPLPPPLPTATTATTRGAAPASSPPTESDGATAAQAKSSPTRALASTASTYAKPPTSRRATLTLRFPLLRKGHREPSASLGHFRSSSVTVPATVSPQRLTDSPLLLTRAPRASPSNSSSPRVRSDHASDTSDTTDPTQPRDQPTRPSTHSDRHEPADGVSLHSPRRRLRPTPSASSISTVGTQKDGLEEPHFSPLDDAQRTANKMHQTSSRLVRMTDDERPFTRDFKDLFSTLMVSLPLSAHRVRFRMIDFTFTSDEAITNLGSLKFSQSNRMPDPKDSSRVVTTTTTTTFSMAKEMARSVCQKFLEAKFIESVEGKVDFQNKSSVWQLTPKGILILDRFCSRNGIQSAHVKAVIESARNPHQLVVLERNTETDRLHNDEQSIEIIFRRFVGLTANESAQSDSDSIHEFYKCDVGVRMAKHKPTSSRPWTYTFNGRNAAEWLMDCTTMVDRREVIEIGSLFLGLKMIAPIDPRSSSETFQPVKQAAYYITPFGERVAGWSAPGDESLPIDSNAAKTRDGATRDSNSNRTNVIIRNPSWRLLYREFLKETMCEENLSFYLEVQEFNTQYRAAVNASGDNKIETIRETLAAAYGLYNAFLAPGSPNELNIDHALRTQLATRMTRAVGDDQAMMQSLVEVASLFEKAQNSIFKLMSSDSVPKFIKHPKYSSQLRGLDAAAAAAYAATSGGASRS